MEKHLRRNSSRKKLTFQNSPSNTNDISLTHLLNIETEGYEYLWQGNNTIKLRNTFNS